MYNSIFETVGRIIIFLFAGMGIATFTMISIPYGSIKSDFIFDYKQFKQISIPYGSIKSQC